MATHTNLYFAYGVGFRSEFEMPDFMAVDSAPEDVTITVDHSPFEHPRQEGKSYHFEIGPERTVLFFDFAATFEILGGTRIIIHPVDGAQEATIRLFMMGTVMGMLLSQRGCLVLHASAVRMADGAAAFLGESGFGKSSIAAALHTKGYPLVTDDLSPVRMGTPPTISPGFPRLKLFPEIAEALGYKRESLSELHPGQPKMARQLMGESFDRSICELKTIFVLDREAQEDRAPIRPHEAVIELVRHSYPTRLFTGGGPAHLMKCAELVRQIPVVRLRSFKTIGAIASVVGSVEEHFGLTSKTGGIRI